MSREEEKELGKIKPMDGGYKEMWLEALRSGRYKQGTGVLQTNDVDARPEFCCLGVLRHCVDPKDKRSADRSEQEVLSRTQLREFGLPAKVQTFLAAKNDGNSYNRRWGFKKIANWIEKHL